MFLITTLHNGKVAIFWAVELWNTSVTKLWLEFFQFEEQALSTLNVFMGKDVCEAFSAWLNPGCLCTYQLDGH